MHDSLIFKLTININFYGRDWFGFPGNWSKHRKVRWCLFCCWLCSCYQYCYLYRSSVTVQRGKGLNSLWIVITFHWLTSQWRSEPFWWNVRYGYNRRILGLQVLSHMCMVSHAHFLSYPRYNCNQNCNNYITTSVHIIQQQLRHGIVHSVTLVYK